MTAAALASWRGEPGLLLALALVGAVYLRGFTILRRARPDRLPRRRALAFGAGLVALAAALATPVDALAELLLTAHMVQHMLLTMVAPPLLLLGAPAAPLLRGLPRVVRKDALGPFLASPGLQRLGSAAIRPLPAWLAFVTATWLWHLPAAYELALRDPFWHEVEHAAFLGTALLFWTPVLEPWPLRRHWPRVAMLPYLLLADLQNTALSALITFSPGILYPTYAAAPRVLGIPADVDQAAAGAFMWLASQMAFLLPAAWVLRDVLAPGPGAPRSRPVRGQAAPAPFDLLRVRGLGPLLSSLRFRRVLQAGLVLLAAAVVLDGLLGPRASPLNLAGVLPWTWWRGLVVLGLLAAANVGCMACPFVGVRDVGRRWLRPTRAFPRALRSKWLAVAGVGAYLVAYELLAPWDAPGLTAALVLGYFLAAFLVDGLFRGASFCKYACPIGQFQIFGSTLSPLGVAARDASVCQRCRTHDCIRGGPGGRGCELDLFVPTKRGNLDCTFCLDCVRTCPHDNVGLLPNLPARELGEDRPRSSLGRLSRRPDVAALAALLVAGAFVNAAGMVRPVVEALEAWRAGPAARLGLLVLGLAVAPAVLVATCAAAGRRLGRTATPTPELAARIALAWLPLGMALWAAHLLFHLWTAGAALRPVLQRLAVDAGLAWAGTPDWRLAHAALHGGAAPRTLELLLLDAGLLLTLHAGWRSARSLAGGAGRPLGIFLPFAAVSAGLWALSVWLLLQPMEMRGLWLGSGA